MLAGYSFRPRRWPLALAAVACGAGIALGNWQARRAEEKRALGAEGDQALKAVPIEISTTPVGNKKLLLNHGAPPGQSAPNRRPRRLRRRHRPRPAADRHRAALGFWRWLAARMAARGCRYRAP